MMDRKFVEGMLGITRDTYAWRIDTWCDVEGTPMGEGIVEGPSGAPDDLLMRVRAGEGKRFRLKDDDGNVYCKGRLLVREGTENLDLGFDPEFAPLDDYGTGGLGCTDVEYWERDPKTGTHRWIAL